MMNAFPNREARFELYRFRSRRQSSRAASIPAPPRTDNDFYEIQMGYLIFEDGCDIVE